LVTLVRQCLFFLLFPLVLFSFGWRWLTQRHHRHSQIVELSTSSQMGNGSRNSRSRDDDPFREGNQFPCSLQYGLFLARFLLSILLLLTHFAIASSAFQLLEGVLVLHLALKNAEVKIQQLESVSRSSSAPSSSSRSSLTSS
jgi:hypothetical protein